MKYFKFNFICIAVILALTQQSTASASVFTRPVSMPALHTETTPSLSRSMSMPEIHRASVPHLDLRYEHTVPDVAQHSALPPAETVHPIVTAEPPMDAAHNIGSKTTKAGVISGNAGNDDLKGHVDKQSEIRNTPSLTETAETRSGLALGDAKITERTQSSSLATNIASNVIGKKSGYIYVPGIGIDTANSIIGLASNRLAGAKEPYTVIVKNQSDKNSLNEQINHYKLNSDFAKIANTYARGESININTGGKSAKFSNKDAFAGAAYKAITYDYIIKDNDADKTLSALGSDTKLYIVGHGKEGGGGNGVYIKPNKNKVERISSSDLAKQLKQGGLSSDYEDVRITACYGACQPESGKAATGQLVANAMKKAGFNKVQVTAYPGKDLVNPREFIENNNDRKLHRSVILSGEKKPRRASTRKIIFFPK